MNVTDFDDVLAPIIARAEHDPEWPGVVLIAEDGSRQTITAAALVAEISAFAANLSASGLRRGDVLVLVLAHSRELLAAFFGAMWLGAVPTIFAGYTAERLDADIYQRRLAALLRSSHARAVLTVPERLELLREVAAPVGAAVWNCAALAGDGSGRQAPPREVLATDTIAFLQYTSGSGGVQKGIAHSHRTLLRYIEGKQRSHIPMLIDEVIVSWLPLYHDLGLMTGLLTPQVVGAHTVLMSPLHWVRDPKILFQAITDFRGTLCCMPNFAFNHCARMIRDRDLEGIDLSSLRALICGGEPVRVESQDAFLARFRDCGFREEAFCTGYGMAEVVEAATVTVPSRRPNVDWISAAALQRGQARPTERAADGAVSIVSCGRALPGTRVRIVDDSGGDVAERTIGEIAISSDYLLAGYYHQPELSEQLCRDGWFMSGDLGYLAGGELYLTGRRKDLIIVKGRNIAAEDVERLADDVAGLSPGRAVAFGIPDPGLGSERIVLVVEPMRGSSEEELRAADHALRRRVVEALDVILGDLRIVERGWIIKTSSGKFARPENRQKYLGQFAVGQRSDEPGSAE